MRNQTEMPIAFVGILCIIGAALGTASMSCSGNGSKFQTLTLPSGRSIRAEPLWQLKVLGAAASLHLDYETDLSLNDKGPLRKEVDEIWPVFQREVENRHFTVGIITVHEKPRGFVILKPLGYRFIYRKQSDGNWVRSEDQKSGG